MVSIRKQVGGEKRCEVVKVTWMRHTTRADGTKGARVAKVENDKVNKTRNGEMVMVSDGTELEKCEKHLPTSG
jgi:hypothetical protein